METRQLVSARQYSRNYMCIVLYLEVLGMKLFLLGLVSGIITTGFFVAVYIFVQLSNVNW